MAKVGPTLKNVVVNRTFQDLKLLHRIVEKNVFKNSDESKHYYAADIVLKPYGTFYLRKDRKNTISESYCQE